MRLTGRVWWTGVTALVSVCIGIIIDHSFLRILGSTFIVLVFFLYFYNLYFLEKWRTGLKVRAGFEKVLAGRVAELVVIRFEADGLIPSGFWAATVEPVVAGRFAWVPEKAQDWIQGESGVWTGSRSCLPGFAGFIEVLGFRVKAWDFLGWYESVFFLPFEKRLPICPARLPSKGANKSGKKVSNVLWKPGIFQIDRSGQSLEFLGLRELVPGDSPKRIAWKQSLRRDCLLVRETEWEVPVGVNCLVDAGPSNRFRQDGLHSGFDDLQPLIMAAAQAAMDSQNPFSLSLVDPGFEEHINGGVGKIHLTRMELAIARKSASIPPNPLAAPDALLPQAELLLESLFPNEMNPFTNRLPFWYSWVEGFPAWSEHSGWKRKLDAWRWAFWFSGPIGWMMLPFVFGFTEKERKLSLARKRIALLLCTLGRLPSGAMERLLQDDRFFSMTLTNQMGKMGLTIPAAGDKPVNPVEQQMRVGRFLAGTLLKKLARARDQQVFIVIIQSGTLLLGLGPLIDALRRGTSRGHRMVVLDIVTKGHGQDLWSGGRKDLAESFNKAGVVHIQGSPKEVRDRFESQIGKEGFLGRK